MIHSLDGVEQKKTTIYYTRKNMPFLYISEPLTKQCPRLLRYHLHTPHETPGCSLKDKCRQTLTKKVTFVYLFQIGRILTERHETTENPDREA